jgi:hypothetical protein
MQLSIDSLVRRGSLLLATTWLGVAVISNHAQAANAQQSNNAFVRYANRPLRANFTTSLTVRAGTAFDVIFYVDTLTPAHTSAPAH